MLVKGLTYFQQHFYYSNKFVQLTVDSQSKIPQKFRFQWILFYTIIFYVCPGIFHQFYQLIRSEITLQSAVKVLQNMIGALCILCLFTGCYIQSEQLQRSFIHIKVDYKKLFDKDEIEILQKYEKRSKITVYCLIAAFHLYYIIMLTPCFFNNFYYLFTRLENVQLKLPFPVNSVSNPGPVFYFLLIYQTIAIYILIFLASVCYATLLVLLLHILCQLSLIRMKIGRPFRKEKEHIENTLSNYKLHEELNWIKDIIKSHVRVVKFIDRANICSKDMYLIVICLTMSLIVLDFLNMFQLLSVWQNKSELIESVIYITGSLSVTYLTFLVGQELIDHSNNIFEELCNVPFYTLSLETQKLLLFLIARSMKPCYLQIGNVFVSSHRVFSSLIQKAFSYATVYYNVR